MIETAVILYTLAGVLMLELLIRSGFRPTGWQRWQWYAVGTTVVIAWPVFFLVAVRGAMRSNTE